MEDGVKQGNPRQEMLGYPLVTRSSGDKYENIRP